LGKAQKSKKIIQAFIPPFFGSEAAVLSVKNYRSIDVTNLLYLCGRMINLLFPDFTHTYILYSLFAALRQNRTQKISYGRSFISAPKAQK
jgi:hypothetical protein